MISVVTKNIITRILSSLYYFNFTLAPAILVIVLFTMITRENVPSGDEKSDPNFQFGKIQKFVSLILLCISFFTTLVCMVLKQRARRNRLSSTPRNSVDDPSRYLLGI